MSNTSCLCDAGGQSVYGPDPGSGLLGGEVPRLFKDTFEKIKNIENIIYEKTMEDDMER